MGTPTNNYSLQLPTVGGETGTWGTNLNNNTITPLDQILGNTVAITITSADVNLTNTQFQNGVFNLTGGLTGNRNLFVPLGAAAGSTTVPVSGKFIVTNNTSNSFTVTVNTTASGAVGTIVPQGGRSNLYSDGTNVKTADFGDAAGCFATTFSGNPNGQIPGTAGSTAVGMNTQIVYDAIDNALYACTTTGSSTTAVFTQPATIVSRGFDTAVNLQLSATVSSNALIINVLTSSGATPTTGNPIIIEFPDATVANGDPVAVNVTGALSIATSTAGATFGSANGQNLRLWILAFNNAGTPALALTNCTNLNSSIAQTIGLDEASLASATAMSTSANTVGTIYSSSASAITNKSFRILGYLTYETALATAGLYTTTPDVVRLFGPGIYKPGQIMQTVSAISTQTTSVSSFAKQQTNTQATITPRSNANLVLASASGGLTFETNTGVNVAIVAQLGRGGGPTLFGSLAQAISGVAAPAGLGCPATVQGFDAPATKSATTYSVFTWLSTGSNLTGQPGFSWNGSSNSNFNTQAPVQAFIQLQEIMG